MTKLQKYIHSFLVDIVGKKKLTVSFPDAYMLFFGYVTCAIITFMIVLIPVNALLAEKEWIHITFLTKELGYITILTLALMAAFLFKPRLKADKSKPINLLDQISLISLITLTIVVGIYLSNIFNTLGWIDEWIYSLAIFIILVAVHRADSKNTRVLAFILISLTSYFVCYFFIFDELNSIFDSEQGLFSANGVYGYALVTIVDFVYAVIILSAAFQLVKIDKLLNYLALKMTHNRRSGASSGLYAVWASTFYGAISGETQGNVAKTGKHTIRVMDRAGYKPEFAASIEASISGVGQIVLPIMGTIAFAIIVIDNNISYLNVMLAAIVPALLFILTLVIAVILEAKKLNLQPLKLKYSEEIKQTESKAIGNTKTQLIQLVILIISFSLFFLMPFYGYTLALSALTSTFAIIFIAYLNRYLTKNKKPNWKKLLKFVILSGKEGLDIVIYCATIGIILFIFKQTGLEKFIIDLLKTLFSFWPVWFGKLCLILIVAILPILLGMFLPTLFVFFIMVFITIPVFNIADIPELHAYLFVFYYSVLAGITPPYAPLSREAFKVAEKALDVKIERRDRVDISLRLSTILFILPIAWILHPEIILDTTFSLINDFTKNTYIILTIMLAVLALSVARFGIFQTTISNTERWFLVLAAILIVLPDNLFLIIHYDLMILGLIMTASILIKNDLKAQKDSALKPALHLVSLIIKPKNIPFSVYLTFFVLLLVYTTFFTINGIAIFLQDKAISHWLNDRFHFTFDVTECDVNTNILQQFLKEKGHESTLVCSKHAEMSISKVHPGEVRLQSDIQVIEFKDDYFKLLPQLKDSLQKNYREEADECLIEIGDALKKQDFNPENISSSDCIASFRENSAENESLLYKLQNCIQQDDFSNPPKSLPIIYLGSDLAKILGASPGTLIHLHEGVFSNTLIDDIILTNPKQHFVVAAVFRTRFPDINDKVVILPIDALSNILETSDIENKLVVKIHDLDSLDDLKSLWQLIKNEEDRFNEFDENAFESTQQPKWPYETDLSITDYDDIWETQAGFLKGIQIISLVVLLLCLLVLLTGINQLMDKNKKLVILMRLSGVKFEALWIFLLILSVIGALGPFLLAIPLSLLTDHLLTSIYTDISYGIDSVVFWSVLGITLLVAVLTTFVLSGLHLSRNISKELSNATHSH